SLAVYFVNHSKNSSLQEGLDLKHLTFSILLRLSLHVLTKHRQIRKFGRNLLLLHFLLYFFPFHYLPLTLLKFLRQSDNLHFSSQVPLKWWTLGLIPKLVVPLI